MSRRLFQQRTASAALITARPTRDVTCISSPVIALPAADATSLPEPDLSKRKFLSLSEASVREASLIQDGIVSLGQSLVYIPKYLAEHKRANNGNFPAPVILLFHGAGGDSRQMFGLFEQYSEKTGAILVCPQSESSTWDMLKDDFGPDVVLCNDLLHFVFARQQVDSNKIMTGGFSDGASYALSLGLANGNLFTHILALSPGFMSPPEFKGHPKIFVSHGTNDRVLPVRCSRDKVVPFLKQRAYDVEYFEFNGAHSVPGTVISRLLQWTASQEGGGKTE